MKKISLEHSIRKVVSKVSLTEDPIKGAQTAIDSLSDAATGKYIGPNAGPLGFGVYPQGVPSVKNTERLSPYVPNTRPLDLQKQQQSQPEVQTQQPKTSEKSSEVKTSSSVAEPRKVKTIKINPDGSVKNESYTSLEHSIRNVVSETVGNIVSPKESHPIKIAFNKPVHIEPPKGEEHGDINALNVSNQRKQIKQTQSSTSGTFAEERAPTKLKIPSGGEIGKDVEIIGDDLSKIFGRTAPSPTRPKPVETPSHTPSPVEVPIEPKKVPSIPVKPEPAPVKEPSPAPAPSKEPAPAKEPVPTKEPTPAKEPATSTSPKTSPAEEPVAKTENQTATVPKTETVPQKGNAPKATEKTGKAPKGGLPFIFGGSDDPVDVGKDAAAFPVKTHVHGAGPRSATDPTHLGTATAKQILKRIPMKEENQEDRKKIEYVPRGKLNAKASLGRLSAVKTRIIDEEEQPVQKPSRAAKIKSIVLDKKQTGMGENPIVEKEPRLKPLHLGEADIAGAIERGSQAVANSRPARLAGTVLRKTAIPLTAIGSAGEYADRRAKGQDIKTAAGGAATEFAGSTAGMLAGAKLGAAAGALGGPFAPVTVPLGGIAGAIGGGMLGSHLANKGYDKVMDIKDEDDKPEKPATTPTKPTTNDSPAAVAAEPKKQNKSMFDPTPIKNQGM